MLRILSPRDTREKTSLSQRELKRRAEDGRFPKPVRIGEGLSGRIGYVEHEVEKWCAARIAERDGA